LTASGRPVSPSQTSGRRARARGRAKVADAFSLLAAAVNIARLGVLGIMSTGEGNRAITIG
jgi:hypothetical protein